MCFRIDPEALCPRVTKAWKLVAVNEKTGAVRSVCYRRKRWHTGINRRSRGPTMQPDPGYVRSDKYVASHGIYVYLTKADAFSANTGLSWRPLIFPRIGEASVLLQVIVDPADWLHSSYQQVVGVHGEYRQRRIATYRKVIVPEEQPYIEWY